MAIKLAIIGIRGFPANFPGSSGIDTFVEKIIPYLIKNKKIKVNLYTRSWSHSQSKNSQINIINITCLPNKYLDTNIYSIIATIRAIRENDIFWFHAPSSCIFLPIVKLFNKKIIFTYHGIDWKRKKWSNPVNKFSLKFLEFLAIHFSDHVTAVSENLANYINKKYNISCHLTSPGFEIKKPKKINEIKKFLLQKNKYFLYLGRLVPEKRIEWIIKAFILNKDINQKYKLVIAGFIEKNKYCQNLVKLAKKNKNIIFTDYVTGNIKDELVSNCKIFISASQLEGNSLSINEALEFDKTCLLANIKIHQKISKNNNNIILFKKNSFSDFQQKLNKSIYLKKSKINNQNKQIPWSKTVDIFKKFLR